MFNPERMKAKNRRKAVPLQYTDCYRGGRGCFAPLSSPASAAPAMDQQKGRALKTTTLEKLPGRLSRQTTDGLEGRALLQRKLEFAWLRKTPKLDRFPIFKRLK